MLFQMTEETSQLEQQADRAAAGGDFVSAAALLERATLEAGGLDLWIKLSATRRAIGDSAGALAAIDQALSLAPLDLSALLARAFLLERVGDPRAGEAFALAVAQAPDADAVPAALASALAHARTKGEAHQSATLNRLLLEIPEPANGLERERLERFATNSARLTRAFHQEPSHFHFPAMPAIEFYNPEQFAGLAEVASATEVIRSEFEAVMAAEAAELVPYVQYPDKVPLRQWKALNRNRDWTAIHLLRNGATVAANARHCPRTLDLLSRVSQPVVPGASPNAMFSLLAPGTRIPPHTGVANTRLVAHLPLIVPEHCRFRVGATTRPWVPGSVLVFDDTIEHEAWNDSDELRVVLIFDLWAPVLTDVERRGVAAMIPALGVGFGGGI